jgi:pimeloyl-ACP methyl ester carboxylesterase
VERKSSWADVAGCPIHALVYGDPDRAGIVLVHGGGANAYWWAHLAAFLAADYRVVSIDLSGHGDSGHRHKYVLEQWTDEVIAVCDRAGLRAPVVVGHSMGGLVTIAAAARYPDRLGGAIICDSPVTVEAPEVSAPQLNQQAQPTKAYPTRRAIVERFRTLPPQEHYLDFVIDHVAHHSVRRDPDGWRWKVDRQLFVKLGLGLGRDAIPYLSGVQSRLALVRSEFGLVTPDIEQFMYDELGRVTPVITLPLAGHHPMLDEPLSLLTAVRTLLEDWQHSEPRRRDGGSACASRPLLS